MALSIRTYLVGQGGTSPPTSLNTGITYHQGAGLYTLLPLEEDIMDNRFIGAKTRAERCTASAAARLISDRARQLKMGFSFETQPDTRDTPALFGFDWPRIKTSQENE